MRLSKLHGVVAACIVLVTYPSPSHSAVQIIFRNGRSMTADSCQEADGRFICYKMGGTFELEKEDIATIRVIQNGDRGADVQAAEPEDKKQPADTPPSSKTEEDKKVEGGGKSSQTGEDSKADLNRITQRKSELITEREKLLKDRQQLQDDLKSKPEWMPVKDFDDLKKRNSELDERIKTFNEEVDRLNAEEQKINKATGDNPVRSP
jgi:hypothetical protein